MTTAIDDDDAAIILDMSGLRYISSTGLRSLLIVAKLLAEHEVRFIACSLSELVGEIFRIGGFDTIIEVQDSREDALAQLGLSADR